MRHVTVWIGLSLLIAGPLLASCAGGNSNIVVTPTLFEYSRQFENKAADELDAMKLPDKRLVPPCDRLEPVKPCSALKRFTNDYGQVRDEIRAARR